MAVVHAFSFAASRAHAAQVTTVRSHGHGEAAAFFQQNARSPRYAAARSIPRVVHRGVHVNSRDVQIKARDSHILNRSVRQITSLSEQQSCHEQIPIAY